MKRTQIQLTERQAKALRRIASREHVSMSEVIRRALDRIVESEALPDREELKRRALSASGSIKSGVPDLAERHDDYWAEDIADDHIH